MDHADAIDTIAQHVIAMRARGYEALWETYPEIGEGDWCEIDRRAAQLTPYPQPAAYDQAYRMLEALAEDWAAKHGG